ncbi:hypothetical protein [Allobranchiibius huperziae]|uniref:Glycosyltransferase RgtA/B/C/D-like domain-containing protein n=1 Tax=Allobranchiibius huperziae TaxID=1874116 RepID=A0A853DHW2_9MICO|nr:hypothetical protein [Allobranchiibius huperziae]NYJ76348.1 hypothetical protein [Allobranchiibius huperziae]
MSDPDSPADRHTEKPVSRPAGRAERAATWLQRAIGAGLCLLVLGILVHPQLPNNGYDRWVVTLATLLVAAAAWFVPRRLRPVGTSWSPRRWMWVGAGTWCAGGVLALYEAYFSGYHVSWDAGVVKQAALLPRAQFTPFLVEYFSRYPNNAALMAVDRLVWHVQHATGVGFDASYALLNAALFMIASGLLYLTVRVVRGAAWAVVALLLMDFLIGVSAWMSVPYTDLLALWTPIGAVLLLIATLRSSGWRGPVLAALAGIALGIGYQVKVTPVVGLVAFAITALFAVARRGRVGRVVLLGSVAAAVLAFLAASSLTSTVSGRLSGTEPLTSGHAASPMVYVAQGLRVQYIPDDRVDMIGGYDGAIDRGTYDMTGDQQARVARSAISRRLRELGPGGLVRFEANKMAFNWGDGMFWAHGEGHDMSQPPTRTGAAARPAVAWSFPGHGLYRLHVDLANTVWFSLLLLTGLGLLRSRYSPEVLLLALTVVGIAVFVLLFQGRSRYLIGHVPVLIALACALAPRRTAPSPTAERRMQHARSFVGRR